MLNSPDNTQPSVTEIQPPPRWLMVLVSGGFLVLILGTLGSFFLFRDVLRPGQQQRVIDILPFMEAFLPQNPGAGLALPTPLPTFSSELSPDDLLNVVLVTPTPEVIVVLPSPTANISGVLSTATPTMPPAATETLAPTATLSEVSNTLQPTSIPIPLTAYLNGFRYIRQTWNNCGPATITMGLSYFGWEEGQEFAASVLKPDDEDKNVTSSEMISFVNERSGVRAISRMGGTLDLIKTFIANGFPVIIGIGFMPEGYDWLGHYRLLVGYDDYQGVFFAYDSYLGTGDNENGIAIPYDETDSDWRQFNRKFIVLYLQEQEQWLRTLLGDWDDPARAAEFALQTARDEARTNPQDGFAWFNMGTSLVALDRYDEAAVAYDQSRRFSLPWRMMWYQFGPYEAYFNVGRYDDLMALIAANLNNGGQYVEETFYWQGQVYAVRGQVAEAETAFEQALRINPYFAAAQEALSILDPG